MLCIPIGLQYPAVSAAPYSASTWTNIFEYLILIIPFPPKLLVVSAGRRDALQESAAKPGIVQKNAGTTMQQVCHVSCLVDGNSNTLAAKIWATKVPV